MRYTAYKRLDDLAYGTGLWSGVIAGRDARARHFRDLDGEAAASARAAMDDNERAIVRFATLRKQKRR